MTNRTKNPILLTMEMTIEANKYGTFSVYEFGVYPNSSVLAGQTRKSFLDMFDTIEDAKAAYPEAAEGFRDPNNYFDHLPDEPDW